MKFEIGTYEVDHEKYPEICPKAKADSVLEFDTDWFVNTTPSIRDARKLVPDCLDDICNEDTEILIFLAEYSEELLETNDHILCEEAKEALRLFNGTTCKLTEDNIATKKINTFEEDPF